MAGLDFPWTSGPGPQPQVPACILPHFPQSFPTHPTVPDKNLPSFWVLNELIFIFASPSKKGNSLIRGK
jgi:hypothetical protein